MTTNLNKTRRIALWAIPAVLVLGGVAFGAKMLMPAPADLDYALTRPSDLGTFTATVAPATDPIVIEEPQTWTVEIAMADGTSPDLADITVDGGMPQHGHGFPTKPRITREVDEGTYLLEGMKFSMTDWWDLKLGIQGAGGADAVVFNIVVDPTTQRH